MAKKATSSSSSSAATATTKRRTDKPPPLDRWIFPAVGIVIAMLGYHFIKGMLQQEILRVNLDDELELREIFFGEDTGIHNYAVLCHPESAKYPISSVFHDAAKDGSAPALFRVMDCDHILASSEKSVKERFNLDDKVRPLVFVSGKMGSPRQVPSKHLKTGTMLSKALKNLLTPKAEKIETTQDLRTKCLDKPICALLLKGSKQSPNYVKDAMAKLLVEYPKIAFAAVDTSVLYVKGLEAEYLPQYEKDIPRFAVFEKIAGSADKKNKDAERLKTSVVALPKGGVSYGPMSNLIASVIQKSATMSKVPALPTIKTRTKKLEQEEQQKRDRRDEQQRRKEGGGGSGGGSAGTGGGGGAFRSDMDNDGSADGRRAERERRREEHRKNNPNYKERTPEEIAEMERQRRIRMEEEAQKWNIAPEDMPDEGQYEGAAGDDGDYFDEDWDDATDGQDNSGTGDDSNDDEDDVMDLD